MPTPSRRKLPRELFETRSHAWQSLGLGDQPAPRAVSKRALGGLLVALVVLAAALVAYSERERIAPGYGDCDPDRRRRRPRHRRRRRDALDRARAAPRLYRRLDPATGTTGFVLRLLTMAAVVILALPSPRRSLGTA